MGMPHVTSFCWCMDLSMGATFIGYMHLIVSICLISLTSYFAESLLPFVGTVEDEDGVYSTWYVIAVVVAVLTVAHVLLAVTLLYGVYKRRARCVRVWVCAMCALCGAAALGAGAAACAGLSRSGADIFLPLLEGILFFGVLSYFIISVNSYYLYLRSLEDELTPMPKHI